MELWTSCRIGFLLLTAFLDLVEVLFQGLTSVGQTRVVPLGPLLDEVHNHDQDKNDGHQDEWIDQPLGYGETTKEETSNQQRERGGENNTCEVKGSEIPKQKQEVVKEELPRKAKLTLKISCNHEVELLTDPRER